MANAASLVMRSGLSPAVTSSVVGAQPGAGGDQLGVGQVAQSFA
jgi:hypothetical protein